MDMGKEGQFLTVVKFLTQPWVEFILGQNLLNQQMYLFGWFNLKLIKFLECI